MILEQIIKELSLEILTGCAGAELQKTVSCGCVSDMMSEVMARAPKGCLWITHQTNENVVAIAYFKELAAIVLPNGLRLEDEILEKGILKNIIVLASSENAYELAGKLYALGIRGTP
jgi:hypothetical protein